MKTNRKVILSLSVILTVGIILNINFSLDLHRELEAKNPQDVVNVESVRFQSATVVCIDTEHYGGGANRDRVCAHGTTAFCDWEYWDTPPAGNQGKCTLTAE
ncbi:MAG: hypothetical protein FH748_16135 [Balneolaceae bacterium]|nr:hypothetical protein [Balneolaceae bacterium]